MRIRTIKEALQHWDHIAHYITLALVGIALACDFLLSRLPNTPTTNTVGEFLPVATETLQHALHWVHITALILAGGNLVLWLVRRNTGHEAAQALGAGLVPSSEPASISDYIKQYEDGYQYKARPVAAEDIEFVTSSTGPLAAILFDINRDGFEGSAFEMDRNEIEARNSQFIEKNLTTFMLIRNPLRELCDNVVSEHCEFIGFTCVLPLNESGSDYYLNGLIKDRDVRASFLAKKGDPCENLLVFAIALRKEYRKYKGLAAKYYPFLLRCTEHHIRVVQLEHPHKGPTTVWAQSEHRALKHHFVARGFTCGDNLKSGDGFELYKRRIDN
jgi:hypothetical protein